MNITVAKANITVARELLEEILPTLDERPSPPCGGCGGVHHENFPEYLLAKKIRGAIEKLTTLEREAESTAEGAR